MLDEVSSDRCEILQGLESSVTGFKRVPYSVVWP